MAVATFLASISAIVGVIFVWAFRPPDPVPYRLKDWAVQVNAVCDKKWVDLDFRKKLRVAADSLVSTIQSVEQVSQSLRAGGVVDAQKYQELKVMIKDSVRAFQDVGDANRQLIGLLHEVKGPESSKDERSQRERDRIEQVFRHGNNASDKSTEIADGLEKIDFANPSFSMRLLQKATSAVRNMEQENRLWQDGLRRLGADHCT